MKSFAVFLCSLLEHRVSKLVSYLIAPLLFILLYVGNSYSKPMVTAPLFFALVGFLVAVQWPRRAVDVCSGADLAVSGAGERVFSSPHWLRISALAGGALLWILLSSRTYQGMVLYPNRTPGFWVAVALAVLCLLVLLVRPLRPSVSLGILAVGGLAVRAFGILQWEITPARRDMVPLIYSALETFVGGENPYRLHQMQAGSEVPLTYPPGLWLAHLPAYLAGIDIRWVAWISDAIILVGLGYAAIRWAPRVFGPVFLALTFYIFLPDVHWNAIYAEPHFDWAVVSLLCVATLSRRPVWVGVAYGVALLTRPFNVLFAPFLALWLWRKFGWRRALRSLLISGVIAAVVYVPFVAADPNAFYLGTVRWLVEYGPAHSTWFHGILGFSGPLYERGLGAWLTPIQLTGFAVLLGLAVWKLRTTGHLIIFWLLVLAHFVGFNSLLWMSFWIGVILIAIVVPIARVVSEDELMDVDVETRGRLGRVSPVALGLEISTTVVVVGSLVFLLSGLNGYFSESGRDAVQDYLGVEAKNGDLILDRVAYRTAFLKKNYIFEGETLPSGVRLLEDPFTQALPRRMAIAPFTAERIWVVERYGLFGEFESFLLGEKADDGVYKVGDTEQFGRFRVLRLDRQVTAKERASAQAATLQVGVVEGGERREAAWSKGRWDFENAEGWQYVGPTDCKLNGVDTKMLWAHPWEAASLEISVPRPANVHGVAVFGGLNDRAPVWGSAPVKVEVRDENGILGAYEFINRPGMRGKTFVLPENGGALTFRIDADDVGRRHFCIDAVYY